jgi:hypothetical protein
MSEEKLDRRTFFRRAATLGAAVTGAGALLSACKSEGGGSAEKSAGTSGGTGSAAKQPKGGGGGELNCMDAPGLTKAQKNTRKSLKYADSSDKEGQLCDNCQYWEPAKNEGECGGCQVVPGPIHPKGWCSSWTKMKG